MDVPHVSRFSVITDPQNATLALIKGRQRGEERIARPGAAGQVSWHELLALDLEKAFAFYGELFGWRKADSEADQMGTYQHFSFGTEMIGGMFTKSQISLVSIWLYYFNVDDIEAAARRVKAGGGRVLYGPIAVQGGARVVHCADPQNAIFGLIDRHVRVSVGCYSA
jgi:predicted enzyme related to lactoylglutathione lyase